MADRVARALAAIVDEARAEVAAGREPDAAALEARIRAAATDDAAGRQALDRLARVLAVHRARKLVVAGPAPAPTPAKPPPRRRLQLSTRPTITGNMDVRREPRGETPALVWDAAREVAEWEVRISERPDPRADYAVRETLALPAGTTSVELPELGDRLCRVHVLGRGRDGRLRRRAIVSGLTRETWQTRWQRKASAS